MSERKVEIDKDALFAQLRYSPHPGQQLVHEATARFRVLACGARWGKTTCSAMEAVCELLAPRKQSMGWVVAPTYELTKHITDRVRIAFLQHMKHRVTLDDTRSTRLVIQNLGGGTSELRGKSADNPTSLLGEALDWVLVDEAATMREEIWPSYIAPRLVDRSGRALLISTPRGMGWFFDLFHRGQDSRDPEFWSHRAPSTDNPHIDAAIVDGERKRMTKDAFEQEYLARFLGEENLPCETCRRPSPEVCGVFLTLDLAEEPRCPSCGHLVDDYGRTVVGRRTDGKPRLRLIDGSGGLAALANSDPTFDVEACKAAFRAARRANRQP